MDRSYQTVPFLITPPKKVKYDKPATNERERRILPRGEREETPLMVNDEFKREFSDTFNRLWLVFFAHHTPDKFHRCLKVQIRGKKLYFCARCTGILSGTYTAIFLFPLFQSLISPLIASIILIAFPLPVIVDWLSQYGGKRESNNKTRVASGFLLGFSIVSLTHSGEYILKLITISLYVILVVLTILIIKNKGGSVIHGSG